MIIVIDGPEKAGKSTIIRAIQKLRPDAKVRRWGPVASDTEYLEPLKADTRSTLSLSVWDRSWASEHVYSKLLARGRRLDDGWLGEWLYGRAVRTMGAAFMVVGPNVETITRGRDATDLPVDPAVERDAFWEYGGKYGWHVVLNPHTPEAAEELAAMMVERAETRAIAAGILGVHPPTYCGPVDAKVVVVGQERNEGSKFPGAWLPFSTSLTIEMARAMPRALAYGWTNALDCPPQALRHAKVVVACGKRAEAWATYHVGFSRVLPVAHPAYAFRFDHPAARKSRSLMLRAIAKLAKEDEDGGENVNAT
jgi:hypothetical protein